MTKKRVIYLISILLIVVVIIVTAITISFNEQKSSSNSNDNIQVTVNNTSTSSNDGTVPIFPNDFDEIKSKKEEYNKIEIEGKQINDEYLSGKISHDEYVKEGKKLREKLDATGINPKDYETPEHRYEERYECNILDKEMLNNDYTDDQARVIPEYKEKYELNNKRKEYIMRVTKIIKREKYQLKKLKNLWQINIR